MSNSAPGRPSPEWQPGDQPPPWAQPTPSLPPGAPTPDWGPSAAFQSAPDYQVAAGGFDEPVPPAPYQPPYGPVVPAPNQYAATPYPPNPYGANPYGATPYGAPNPYAGPNPYAPSPYAPYGIDPVSGLPYSDKSKLAAGLLQVFLGGFGVGRFYLGDVGIGVAQILVTFLTFGLGILWPLIDGIMLLAGSPRDKSGRPLHP